MATVINKPTVIDASQGTQLTVSTDVLAPYRYQWKRNGIYFGANDPILHIPPMKPVDFRASYTVTVYGQDASETSAPLILNANMQDVKCYTDKGDTKHAVVNLES